MSDALTLARALRGFGDDALTRLLVTRQVPVRDIRDYFDLADALLAPSSIRDALPPFDRAGLEQLAGHSSSAPVEPSAAAAKRLTELALALPASEAGPLYVFDAVRHEARAVLASPAATAAATATDAAANDTSRPTAAQAAPVANPGSAAAAAAAASEHAFTALASVSELIQQLRAASLRIRARGGVAASDEKKLAPVLGVDPSEVSVVVQLAEAARLVTVDADSLVSTTAADGWDAGTPGSRWLTLAHTWFSTLEPPIRRVLTSASPAWPSGDALQRALSELYPAADDRMRAELAHADGVARFLGLTSDSPSTDTPGSPGEPTAFTRAALAFAAADDDSDGATPGSAATTPDPTPLTEALDQALPPEVGQIYLQHDLSIVAPGPLSPAVDARIRLLADLETRGVASTFRIAQQSIDRALATGETEQSLREFLASISLTGLPQAVDYLITEGGRRHGLVRVRRLPGDPGRSRIGSDPRSLVRAAESLRGTLAVDQSLASLAFRSAPDGALLSPVEPDSVYWILVDARYPVLAEDENGDELVMRRARVVAPPAETPRPGSAGDTAAAPSDAVAGLVLRLRAGAAQAPDDATAWISRLLDQAVRARTPVTVDVRMPDASTVHLDVTPLSLANGRLRCVDVRAGIERTVPVANILKVSPVSPD